MNRRLLLCPALAAAVLLVPTTGAARTRPKLYVAPAGSGALFLVSGHGWGHGVGMGQWGAQGYALQGYTYDAILAAYYPGTMLAQTTVRKVRVLMANGKKRLTVSSDQPISVVDGAGAAHTLPAGSTKLTPPLQWPAPLTLSPAPGTYLVLGRAYRGKLVVDVVNGKLRAVNVVGLQQYLDSVVASEMSSSWLPDALEAQAVASRSFALANRKPGAAYDVSAGSQAYLGVSSESPQSIAAVDATAGDVLMYGTKIATTVYSSSTGGRTQSAADAWGGTTTPYLASVPDPYDTISPWHDWGPAPVTGKDLAAALGIAGKPVDATVTRNASKRVAHLNVTSLVKGTETATSSTGAAVAGKLGLRSTWFSVGVLSLQPPSPNAPVPAGSTVTLTGVVRGAKNVSLQQRPLGGAWTTVETIAPTRGTGAFSVDVTPAATTDYRLATAADAAAYVRIRVQ